jgi:hypothetical protein
MISLKEIGSDDGTVFLRVEGILTWSTAGVLREACELYRQDGIARVGLIADQLRGVDLPAVQVLQDIESNGMEIRFHEAGRFLRVLLTSHGLASWLTEPGTHAHEGVF